MYAMVLTPACDSDSHSPDFSRPGFLTISHVWISHGLNSCPPPVDVIVAPRKNSRRVFRLSRVLTLVRRGVAPASPSARLCPARPARLGPRVARRGTRGAPAPAAPAGIPIGPADAQPVRRALTSTAQPGTSNVPPGGAREAVPVGPARPCRSGPRGCAGRAREAVPVGLARLCRSGPQGCARISLCSAGRRACRISPPTMGPNKASAACSASAARSASAAHSASAARSAPAPSPARRPAQGSGRLTGPASSPTVSPVPAPTQREPQTYSNTRAPWAMWRG
jgi:hypothetical protein